MSEPRVFTIEEVDSLIPTLSDLVGMWVTSIARLCIGLRQRGTGGAFLLTPKPIERMLQVKHPFAYPRLGDAAILRVLDEGYLWDLERAQSALTHEGDPVPADLVRNDLPPKKWTGLSCF